MRIVFVGGGTGGHFYPLIATAEALRARDEERGTKVDLYYMGPDAYSKSALDTLDIKFVYCPAGKQRLYRSFRNYTDFVKIFAGIFVAFYKLLYIYPDVVMSKGGYTSVPIIIASWFLRIPIIIHESDAKPGRANVFAARFAKYIGIAHDDVASSFPASKVALVGMPIRAAFFTKIANPEVVVGVPSDRPVILATGGSLGAQRINDLIIQSLPTLLKHYTIIHQTGDEHTKQVTDTASNLISDPELLSHYYVVGHLEPDKFAAAQQASSLIISRAGSGTIFEIALLAKPSILIPIPEDISRDQRSNAYAYARSGGATVIEEHNLNDDILLAEIQRIMTYPGVYDEMVKNAKNFTVSTAAYTLADVILSIGKDHE